MEANRDAALKCRALAEKYLKEGNKAKCLSLCDKAERLAGGSLAGVDRLRTLASASTGGAAARESTKPAATPTKQAFTPQQVEAVKKIIAAKRRGACRLKGRPRSRPIRGPLPFCRNPQPPAFRPRAGG